MIPLFRPSVTDAEIEAVTAALRSGWWGMGPRTAEFERRFAAWAGAEHAVAVSSCTAALQLALEAAGVRYGEVIIPALTFASTGLAVLHNRCKVVFADICEDTLCIDWADVARKATPDTQAVIPVWYGGTVTPHPGRGPWGAVIEDCAHAAGSAMAGRTGLAGCWSFQAVKNLATGDGGMITTDDGDLAGQARRLRWCGIDRSTWERESRQGYNWDYDIREAGHKAHMNDLTAALGLAQLERLDEMNKARRELARRYVAELSGPGWLRLPPVDGRSATHLFYVRAPAADRDALIGHLLRQGVSAGVHYKPLNRYAVFGRRQDLPVTDRVWRELVTLPLYPDMTPAEQEQVIAAVRSFRPGRET